ncbi:sensor histidine kinase [Chitinophaga nivalis]|uniref:Histidine kinase n=1 Tax=Chitinophaga nivalis TaxID=2991709 RepID=A0ABT3IGG7_9BACT|nr:histidine kinase [Chitinophaga nivalis]MCW3467259.1 histidine kinase [Chitinophaga nivalis]MCW3483049.1 histidine kinase [Chitinophaga nivalis]
MKQEWYRHKAFIIFAHLFVWVLLYVLPLLLSPAYGKQAARDPGEKQIWNFYFSLHYCILIGLFYLNAGYLIPQLINKKKYTTYFISLLVIFTTFCCLRYGYEKIFLPHRRIDIKPAILYTFLTTLFNVSSSTAYQMIRDKISAERNSNVRENENLKTELSLLRSQVSPHFMFNVLNNMVSLARKKSDLLEPSLIKLSSLMRYMLYETDGDKVPLEKETEYLQSYIDLQQQRFGKNVAIQVSMLLPEQYYEIEPMLLIPFVENAFKHGTGLITDAQITIHLYTTKNQLFFSVRNKFNNNGEIKDKTSGIGLTNVKRRLNLLYGDDHVLQINRKAPWFAVSLTLNLH